MSRFLRAVKWLVLGFGLFLALVVVAAAIYTRTESFNQWARAQMTALINDSIRGSVAVERLAGSVWGRLTMYKLVLRDEGTEIAKLPRIDIRFSLLPLIFGRLEVARLDVSAGAEATLRQDPEGEWNLVQALSPRVAETESSGGIGVIVRRLRLRDATIEVHPAGGKSYRISEFGLEGHAGLRPTGTTVNLQEITALLSAPGQPDLRLKGGLGYQTSGTAPGVLKVNDLWAVSHNSRVKLNGRITETDPLKISARARLEKLAAADLAYFAPDLKLKHDLAGRLTADGKLDDLQGELTLGAAGATVIGRFHANLLSEEPQYTASMKLRGLSLQNWLGGEELAGVVSGTAEAKGDGFTLAKTQATARLEMREAQVQGWALGSVLLEGRLQDTVAAVDGRLKSQLGGAEWHGKIALAERRPSYELALSVHDLDVKKTTRSAAAPLEGTLNFKGVVKGAGFNLADMSTRADLRVLPSTLGPVKVRRGEFNVNVSQKKIRIERGTLETPESTLRASGEIGLGTELSGQLDYRLRVADIGPWLALVQRQGSGAVDLAGMVRGNLANLRTEGSARLSGVRAEGVALRQGRIQFALQGSKEETFPRGTLTMRLTALHAGVSLRSLDANAKLIRQPAEVVQLHVAAQDEHDRKHALTGSVAFSPGGLTVHLDQASLALPNGSWSLVQPATLNQREATWVIDRLTLRNGAQKVSLHGRFGLSGAQNLALEADGLPLETLSEYMPKQPPMTGRIALTAEIAGTAAAPEIKAALRLSDATIASQAYAGARLNADYKNQRIRVQTAVQQDATHFLTGSGSLPFELSWQNGFHAKITEGMDFRIQSAGISLGFLNAFTGQAVENIGGEVSLDLRARGSLAKPDLRGLFQLRDGKAKIIPLGVEIDEIAIAGNLAPDLVTIKELTARSQDGEIRGRGSLALKQFNLGTFNLVLNARRWPAIKTARYQAKVVGNVAVQGSLAAPQIKGQVTVIEGTLRPDLDFLQSSKVPLERDETIVVVNGNGAGPPAKKTEGEHLNDSGYFKRLSLNVDLRAPGNLWIRHPELVAELKGEVRARKPAGGHLDLIGRIEMGHGWFGFQGRRFELARGVVEFTGGDEINPALDILAQYRLSEYEVNAAIGGTVKQPSLALTSTPQLEQADILALLIFGKPMAALNQKEQGSLQQSALGITSGYVAGKIANSVSRALGLESLGVDIQEVDFSGGKVGFGRYVGRGTYVSLSQQLSGERGREASVEYQIAPNWKISSSTTITGSNGIDIIWHKRY